MLILYKITTTLTDINISVTSFVNINWLQIIRKHNGMSYISEVGFLLTRFWHTSRKHNLKSYVWETLVVS